MAVQGDRQATQHRLAELERLRVLIQAVIDYNEPLTHSPSQQASAQRRIAEAQRQLANLDQELADLRAQMG